MATVFRLLLACCFAGLVIIASAWAAPAHRTAFAHAVDVGDQLPTWDAANGAWRDAGALVPAEPHGGATGAPNTVTVTAVVLPGRLVTIHGSHLRIEGNSTGPGWWSVRTSDGMPVTMDEPLWARIAACMAHAQRERGLLCEGS
jgi:hypothetical protein